MRGPTVTLNSRRVQIVCLTFLIASASTAATAMRPATAQPVFATAESAEAYLQTGWDRLNGGDFEAAATAFRHAVQLKPDLAAGQLGLGVSLANLHRYAEAVEAFERSIALRPDVASAYMNLGLAYVQLDNKPSALDAFQQAARISPRDPRTHVQVGLAFERAGRHDDAIGACR